MDSVVSTGDKDLAQLISPRITLVNTMSNEILDEQSVVAKFGVRADQVLDLLTLTGDAVDNVPGVPKVGPKTAAKWLAQYGTLENLVAHAAEIGGVIGENLRATLAWLPQGRRLLTIKTDCDVAIRSGGPHRAAGGCAKAPGALRALRVQDLGQGPRTVQAGGVESCADARRHSHRAPPWSKRRARARRSRATMKW